MNEKIKPLQIIHLGICAGTILVYCIITYFSGGFPVLSTISPDSIIYILIPVVSVFLSHFMYKTLLKKIEPEMTEEEQFSSYQSANIIRWGILEAGALAILFLRPDIIIFGLILILFMIIARPTAEKMSIDIQRFS